MKNKIPILLFLIIQVATASLFGQPSPRRAVTVTSTLLPPYPVYLADYVEAGSNKFTANVLFNDFNEPSREIYLKIRIESSSLKLETKPEFFPKSPFTVYPGINMVISGDDLYEYFDWDNLVVTGVPKSQLAASGRLPEGFYTFCTEVWDYQSRQKISNTDCKYVNITLGEPPVILQPACESIVKGQDVQNIVFQWQSPNTNPLATEYKLTLYEIPDPQADPKTSIANGVARQIFQSEPQTLTTFNYDMSAPLLDKGMKYAFTVQASNTEGKDLFKNDGISEVCWFHYGWPEGGTVNLVSPPDKESFTIRQTKYFEWSAPDNLTNHNQPVAYEVKIVKTDSLDPADALEMNPAWYTHTEPSRVTRNGGYFILGKPIEVLHEYAWQVKAFSDDQEIAKSLVQTFYGPPVIEEFYAGNHKVKVLKTYNTNKTDLSGQGEIRLSKDENGEHWEKVEFEHLNLINTAGLYVLHSGAIKHKLPDFPNIILSPRHADNDSAIFYPDSIRLDRNGLYIKGTVEWDLPFPSTSKQKAVVQSRPSWINFNSYQLLGNAYLHDKNQYDLLEPFNFRLELANTSDFFIVDNKYTQRFNGKLLLPENITGSVESRVSVPFSRVEQLFYLPLANLALNNPVRLVRNTKMYLQINEAVIDLSNKTSPEKFISNNKWKGLYINDFDLVLKSNVDRYGQLTLINDINKNFTLAGGDSLECWAVTEGLYLDCMVNFTGDDKSRFNDFPSQLTTLEIDIDNSSVNSSQLMGKMKIPLISETKDYTYTVPVSNDGFQNGYLDEELAGQRFAFNPDGGDQKLFVTINRAVFAEKKMLDMNVSVEWPSLGMAMDRVEGLRLWGNYDLGFGSPNGTVNLNNQVAGKMGDFPITSTTIGAGKSTGIFAFGTSATIVMSDDVAGADGPPVVNIYSIDENPLLGEYQTEFTPETTTSPGGWESEPSGKKDQGGIMGDLENAGGSTDLANLEKEINQQLNFSHADIIENSVSMLESLTQSQTTSTGKETPGNGARESETVETLSPAGLSAAQKEELERKMYLFVSKNTRFVTSRIEAVTGSVTSRIDSATLMVAQSFKNIVDTVVNNIAEQIDEKIEDEFISGVLIDVTRTTSSNISNSLTESLVNYVDTAISTSLRTGLSNKLNLTISTAFNSLAVNMIEKGSVNDHDMAIAFDKSKDVLMDGPFTMEKLKMEIRVKTSGLINEGLNPELVFKDMMAAVKKESVQAGKQFIEDQAKELVSNVVDEYMGETALAIVENFPMDMSNVAEKLAKGDLKGALSLDKINIALNSRIVSFNGEIGYNRDDPVYGGVWRGNISATIKTPKTFNFTVQYVTGKKDDNDYWFCQLLPGDGRDVAINDTSCHPLANPMNLGPVQLVGASGRLYHHMRDNKTAIVPDPLVNYGAYMHLVLFDSKKEGKTLRLEVAAAITTETNGDYVVDFDGNMQVRANNPTITGEDKSAVGAGGVSLHFNSAESHFIGNGWLVIEKTGQLCMEGVIYADIKPGEWMLSIGTREERIIVVPACAGWSPTGWLTVDQSTAELGLGVQFSIDASAGFDVSVVALRVNVSGGVAAGIQAKVQYAPSFQLMHAGLWAEIWAKVVVDYIINLGIKKSGSIELIDLYASADLLVIFNPPPSMLKGNVEGYLELLGIVSCDFEASIEKQL